MADFHRVVRCLLWFVVGLLLGGVSTWASAGWLGTKQLGAAECGTTLTWFQFTGETQSAVCNAFVPIASQQNSCSHVTYTMTLSGNTCVFTDTNGTGGDWSFNVSLSAANCPSGQAYHPVTRLCAVSPTCADAELLNPDTWVCELQAVQCPAAGTLIHAGLYPMGASVDFEGTACSGSCWARFAGNAPAYQSMVNGYMNYWAEGKWEHVGGEANCSSSPVPVAGNKGSIPPISCGAGQIYGQVNGKDKCIDPTTGNTFDPIYPPADPATPPPTVLEEGPEVTNPDGSTTKTTTKTNSDGSVTTTKTTTRPDGSVTTTVTTTPPVNEDPKKNICEENPLLPMCTEGKGKFTGTCGAFVCEGDPIQCAMAREQYERNCAVFEVANDFSDMVDRGAVGGTAQQNSDGAAALNLDGSADWNMYAIYQSKQQAYFSFAAECPSVLSFELRGTAYNFDTSALCEIGNVLRLLLHLSAYMAVMGLLARSI